MPSAMTSAVPTTGLVAGRYRLERLLGHGGMADVYRAQPAAGGQAVAVKVVRSTDPELARRLTREAKALSGFDHPGLVRLLEAGVHDHHAYLVMELVEGPTLDARLRRGPLSPDRAAALGTALAGALAYVHGRGVVHRDVKPANVLLGPGTRARLADFGIAQVLDSTTATVTGTTLGTAAYMAPEQLADHRVGPSADVWALGSVLLEALTGRRSFEGAPAEVVARRLSGELPSAEALPTPWRILLTSMLDADPLRRPEAADVAEMLRSPAFARAWDPRLSALEAPASSGDGGPEAAAPPGAVPAGAAPARGATPGVVPESPAVTTISAPRALGPPTLVAPVPATPPPSGRARRRGLGRDVALVAALVLILIGAGAGAWALVARATADHDQRKPPATTTTTVTTTTTTTTAPPVTVASAEEALVNDVQKGESDGALADDVAGNILNQLGGALSAFARGNTAQAENGLGSIDQTITDAESSAMASPQEASALLSDVAVLAGAMGVAEPTTTTAPSLPTAPGGGAPSGGGGGGGNGHGH
jgi:eukaryotic-like serine/threonine-protein kinase